MDVMGNSLLVVSVRIWTERKIKDQRGAGILPFLGLSTQQKHFIFVPGLSVSHGNDAYKNFPAR